MDENWEKEIADPAVEITKARERSTTVRVIIIVLGMALIFGAVFAYGARQNKIATDRNRTLIKRLDIVAGNELRAIQRSERHQLKAIQDLVQLLRQIAKSAGVPVPPPERKESESQPREDPRDASSPGHKEKNGDGEKPSPKPSPTPSPRPSPSPSETCVRVVVKVCV